MTLQSKKDRQTDSYKVLVVKTILVYIKKIDALLNRKDYCPSINRHTNPIERIENIFSMAGLEANLSHTEI